MTKKIITIWKKIRIWSLKRTRVLLIQVRRFFHLKRIRVLLVQIRRFLKKNIRLLKRQKKKLYKQIVSLILLIKNKIKSIESEYKEQRRKLKRVYKKELKFLAQRESLGISFFNEQKKVVFHNKKIQKTYLFLFNLFKKEKNKLFNKLFKKIKKINYFLIKYKNLFIKIINDEKQVFKNLFNSIGDEILKLIDSFESYQKEMEKLFIQTVFDKAPKKANLVKNKAKKALLNYIRKYKKRVKKYVHECRKHEAKLVRKSEKILLKKKNLALCFVHKKRKIIEHQFKKYEKKLIKENKKIFLKYKKIILKKISPVYKSLALSFEEEKKLLRCKLNQEKEFLSFVFRNINLRLFKFKMDFILFRNKLQRTLTHTRIRTRIRVNLIFKEYLKNQRFSFPNFTWKDNLISIEPLLLFLITSALLFTIIPISFLLVKKELPVSNQALIASTSRQILTNNSSEDLKEEPETNISASVGDLIFSNPAPKEEKNMGLGYGVLAINTNKSVFLPNDTAYFQMAALDEQGYDTVCDADLILTIITPSSKVVYPTIKKSGDCGLNNVTDKPDYFAHYRVAEKGTYNMKLQNLENGYEISDSFEVREWVAFDVERIGPTRIYPPANYEIVLKIKANQGFKGRIIENVPASFEIQEQKDYKVQVVSGEKKLIWENIALRQDDELKLKYTFNAPNISPYLYLLGPLILQETQSLDISSQEIRQWQITSDAVNDMILFWDGFADAPTGWTCISCSPGDAYYEYFPRGASSPGGSASTTHSHAISFVSDAGPSAGNGYKSGATENYPSTTHTHPSISSASMNPSLALPPYYELKVIKKASPTTIPQGAIAIFDTSDLPTNWAIYTDAVNYIIRGGSNASTTVTTGHTHSNISFTVDNASDSATALSGSKDGELVAHGHSVSGGVSDAADNEPPYINVILAKATAEISSFTGVIAMFDATPSGDWSPVSAINSNLFIKAAASYGSTGGSSTHSHANKAFTSGATADINSSSSVAPAQAGADIGHTHNITVSFSSESNLPPYLDTVFAKYSPVVAPTLNQRSFRWQNDDGSNVNLNTNSANADTSLTMEKGERAVWRVQVDNTGTAATTTTYKLQFKTLGAGCSAAETWYDATSTTAISYSWGLAGTNNDAITSAVTDTTSSCGDGSCAGFTNGTWHEWAATSSSHTLTNDYNTEFGFMVETSNAATNITYCLRIYNNGANKELDSYSSYGQLSIVSSDVKRHSKEPSSSSLPSGYSDLTYYLDDTGYTAVVTDNSSYDPATSSSAYPIFLFAEKHTTNTDVINIDWNGQTTVACGTNKVVLQVYNISQSGWNGLATSTSCSANTDFSLSTSITTSPSDYYDANYWVYFRVYQDSGSQTLKTDYANIGFVVPAPTFNQRSYRWQNDDGVDVNSNTNSANASTSLEMEKGERATWRVQVDNTGTAAATSKVYKLQFKTLGAGCSAAETWYDATGTTAISYSLGLAGANNDAITSAVTDTSSSCGDGTCTGFTNGSWHENIATTSSHTLNIDYNTEFGFMIETSNAAENTNYCLRLYNDTDNQVLDNYQNYGQLSIVSSATKRHSKVSQASLPTDESDLTYYLDDTGYTAVATDDSSYDPDTSTSAYPIFLFAKKHTNNTDDIDIDWDGQTTVACGTNAVYLQVYNSNSSNWDSLATSTTCSANTDFLLEAIIDTNPGYYYDASNWVYVRVYQASGNQTLKTDYINVAFITPNTFTQKDFRFYDNADAVQPGTAKAAENTAISNIAASDVLRIRMSLTVGTADLSTSSQAFKLQYASTTATCNSGLNWSDLGAISSGTIWRGYNNATPADGATTTAVLLSASEIKQSYEEQNPSVANLYAIANGQEGEWDWVVENNGALGSTAYCFRMVKSDGNVLDTYTNYPKATTTATTFTQNYYRFYDNTDAIQPTTAKADENTAITSVATNDIIRIRTSIQIASSSLATSTQAFKLQYASTTATCSSGLNWSDVDAVSGSAIWRGYNNATPADGATITSTLLSVSDVLGTYEEENNSASNPKAGSVGQDIEYDWVVQNNGGLANTSYCFRMVESDGTVLNTYNNYPKATTPSSAFDQTTFRFYDNADNVQPGTAKAAENTAITNVATNDIVRIRTSIQIASSSLATSTQAFKLQYASTTATCNSGLNWSDLGAISSGTIWRGYNNATPADGATITSTLLSVSDVLGTYEEENNSASNPKAGSVGQDIEYDWVVQNNGGLANTSYCFRMVESDGSVFDLYSNYPKLSTPLPAFDQTTFRFYDNADNVQPTTAKAVENATATDIAAGDVLRIRMSVGVSSVALATSSQSFKLQYASTTAICTSTLNWYDTGAISSGTIWRGYNNTTPADGASITASLLDSQTNKLESYEEQNNSVSNLTAIETGGKGEWDWVIEDNGAVANTDYCFRMTKADGGALDTYTNYPILTTATTTFTQNYYRFYDNTDNVQPTTPKADENTVITNVATNDIVRIRTSVQIASSSLATSTQSFKLQYASTTATCNSGLNWYDTGAISSGTIWRGYNNATPADGATITSTLLSVSDVLGTYEEENNSSSNPKAALVGQDIEYDWVVQNNGAIANTDYCFRMVESDSTVLSSYNNYPKATTPSSSLNQTTFRFYDNADAIQPTTPKANENATATDIVSGEVLRLRMSLEVSTIALATSSQAFKLQYASTTAICTSTLNWYDTGAISSGSIWRGYNNATPADGASITSSLLDSQTNKLQSYEEQNNSISNPSAIGISEKGEWDWVIEDNGAVANTDYCFRMTKADGGALDTYTNYPKLTTATTTFTQNYYRFYDNADAIQPTIPKADENTAISNVATNDVIRIRTSIQVGSSTLATSTQVFKLQYASTTATCNSGLNWSDLGAISSGTIWRGYNNATPADGATITSTLLSISDVLGTYEEENNSTSNPKSASVGQDIEYDWVVQNNGAIANTGYCFRMVESDNTVLSTYNNYPKATTPSSVLDQATYRFYDNADNVQPTTPKANENATATDIVSGEVLRLRMSLEVSTIALAAGSQAFKLQYASTTATCDSGLNWYDTGAISSGSIWRGYDNATPADGASITASLLDSQTNKLESYEEQNLSISNLSAIEIGEKGEWDWVVQNNGASGGANYCFRMTKADGTPLDTYTNYPILTTASTTLIQNYYRFYDNTDNVQPTTPKADENTSISNVATNDIIRIRTSIQIGSSPLATSTQAFKLQYASTTATCDSGLNWYDTGAISSGTIWRGYDNATPSDGVTISSTLLTPSDVLGAYEEENNSVSNPKSASVGQDIEYDWVVQNNGALANTSYCFRMVEPDGSVLNSYTNYPRATTTITTFTQNYYRFYDNTDNVQPTTPKADENTSISNVTTNDIFRIRTSIQIDSSPLATSTQVFKLQYASTTATCTSTLNWYDTGAISSGTIWRGYNNTTPSDGATITSTLLSVSDVLGTYEEENNSVSNPKSASVGQDIEYDWVVQNNGAIANTSYCFRMVESDNTVLSTYNNYPEATTPSSVLDQTTFRFYDNIDAVQPTTPKADENTAITDVVSSDVLRLRMSLEVSTITLAAGSQAFKLQYASTTATCDSGLNWYDTGAISSGTIWRGYNNTSPADGASITASLLDSQINKLESYEEQNLSISNLSAIEIGEKGEWDWVIENNGASASTTYCFKMVKADGTALSAYTQYPKLITVSGPDATSFTNDTESGLTDGGRINQQITVSGSNFGSSCSSPQHQVKIGSYSVSCSDVSSWNSTTITFTIASDINVFGGSNSNGLRVRANATDDSSPLTFYIYPDITSLTTPQITNAAREYSSSDSDGIITINGNRFADSTGIITVLGESATVNSWADTAIAIRIPTSISDNSYTGNIVLTRSSDSKADNWTNFRILPRITSLSPSSAQSGESVVISGNHFCQSGTCPEQGNRASSSDKITINGVLVEDSKISVWTDTSITIEIPDDASSGNIIVRSNNYDSNSKSFTLTGEEEEVPEVTAPAPTHPSGEAPPEPEEEIPSPIIIEFLITDLKIRIINIKKEILRLQEELQKQILPEPEIEEPLPVPIPPEIPEPPVVLPEPLFPPIEIEAPQVLKELGKEIIETTQDVIIKTSEIIDNITDFVGQSFENIAKKTQETTKSVTEFSRQTIKTVDEGISSTISEIKESRDSVIKNIIKQVQENTRKITQFSRQVIKVVDQGIDLIIDRAAYFSDLSIRQLKSYQTYLQIPLQEKLLPEEKVVKKRVVPQPSVSPEIVRIDTIMVCSAFGNIDLDLIDKRAHVIAGKEIAVFIKPSKPVSTLKGFLYFEKTSQIELKHTFYLPFISKVSAASVFAKTYEIQSFKFEGPDEKGFFKAILYMPPVTGEYKLGIDINFIDGTEKSVEKIVLVDPEGYIYEQLKRGELRVKGAKASLFVFDKSTDGYILWPAESYDQKNPQITDQTGQYSFLVPEGKYYIKVEQIDYESYQSEAFEVREGEPIHFNIKLELKSFWQRILK
ncbi:MAG: IPT/TIG domain-containing protein [Candidatus Nealsonbacteria bacterium]